MWAWLSSSDNSATVGALGFLLGVLGFFIGIGGFWITLIQIWRVKTSTAAVNLAVGSLKVRLSHLDMIQECASAERALEEIRIAIEANQSPPSDAKHALSVCFINIREECDLDQDLNHDLDEAITGLSRFPPSPKSRSSGDILKAKQTAAILSYFRVIRKVRSRIQRDQVL